MFSLLRSWQSKFDKSGYIEIILMDLSKAYDCVPHDPLVAKLEGYGVYEKGLCLILHYLTNRRQRTMHFYLLYKEIPWEHQSGPPLTLSPARSNYFWNKLHCLFLSILLSNRLLFKKVNHFLNSE